MGCTASTRVSLPIVIAGHKTGVQSAVGSVPGKRNGNNRTRRSDYANQPASGRRQRTLRCFQTPLVLRSLQCYFQKVNSNCQVGRIANRTTSEDAANELSLSIQHCFCILSKDRVGVSSRVPIPCRKEHAQRMQVGVTNAVDRTFGALKRRSDR